MAAIETCDWCASPVPAADVVPMPLLRGSPEFARRSALRFCTTRCRDGMRKVFEQYSDLRDLALG